MDSVSQRFLEELRQFTVDSNEDSGMVGDHSVQSATCALCQRTFSPENEATGDLETISMCGDCKFLYLEDHGAPTHDSYQGTPSTRRRARNSSSESLDNIFSQQFSHMINLMRQNQSPGSGLEDFPADGDPAARVSQRTSSRTTPSGSRRWRRVLSDTESDGYDNGDSLYGENESNLSFGRYRAFHGESDAISFSAYGGDSDASVDLHGFLDTETIIQPDDGSAFDSDTDIDPMHAGLDQWNSDDTEEEEEEEEDDDDDDDDDEGDEEDDEWEEADAEINIVESREAPGRLRNLLVSSPGGSNGLVNWRQQVYSPESEAEGMIRWRMRGRSQIYTRNIFSNTEESELLPYVGNSGDYLDAGGFEELLEHLAEADSLRRGAPPASVSFVNSLPRVAISKEHEKHDDLACAICKDVLTIGTEVNQLPCSHLYHPSCILPWLSARNTCPLCRYELPTDDRDYEEGKRNISGRVETRNAQQQNASEDSSSVAFNRAEEGEEFAFSERRMEQRFLSDRGAATTNGSGGENSRGRWFLLAAAPIVSLVGIVLVLWLGSPLMERRGLAGNHNFAGQAQRPTHVTGPSPNPRENRSRRWWSLF
ncbi:unnamed protein product [Prunus armeniaca]|uniref:RING-type E3 ubiquitin transferase n=1 Tax=Prunus armeniaca TaxID=36596 RepID=A0A6J5VGH3_PRUAR|nr:unnamed protein product [Prunus armeniaca]